MPTVLIRTYGCQMNERDSEALQCLLRERGYVPTDSEESADVILLNTCSVRDQAERKAMGKIGILKRLKRRRPEVLIGVLGCMAQNHGRAILEAHPHVDLVVGTDRLHEVPARIEEIRRGTGGLVLTETGGRDVLTRLEGHEPGRITAFVAVMRGCNQFCSYCIVPYVRGREKSRPPEDIVAEVEALTRQGVREVVLLGQNITAYGVAEARREGACDPRQSAFAELLRRLDGVSGLRRIRFTSPHVLFMNEAFIEAVCSLPRVCKAFHIPLQSGSDRLLRQMNRGYTTADYLAVVDRIVERVPEATFSTDVMVGFPSETEEDFARTRALMARVDYDMAYVFRYSPRRGTAAAAAVDDVPEEVKQHRNRILLEDLETSVARRNRRLVGRQVEVLVEGPSRRNPSRWQGRTDGNKVTLFEKAGPLQPGEMAMVTVRRTTSHSLFGDLATEPPDGPPTPGPGN